MIYQSQAMHQVIEQARRFANSSATVLITGESGTGKELLARFLHDQSPRRQQAYVRVNCAALSESLVESELFGHESGAFTGAVACREGMFEAAGCGTLFLDEVSEIPLRIQAKLLRVLEEQEFQRVGSNGILRMQARVIAASNRSLLDEVRQGSFRTDLYHRLNVLRIEVPPLRQRKEDIPLLVTHFLSQIRSEAPVALEGLTSNAMKALKQAPWTGNIRELRNVIYRSCLLALSPRLDCNDLFLGETTEDPAEEPPQPLTSMTLDEIERHVILARIEEFNGNKTAAAEALGVTARTLRNKMNHYREMGYVA